MNMLLKKEKEISMCEEGLGISLNDVTIINDAKLKGLPVSELTYACGAHSRGQKNARNEKIPKTLDEALSANSKRAMELLKANINWETPQVIAWTSFVHNEIRQFIQDVIENCKLSPALNLDVNLIKKFKDDFFPEIKEGDYFVADGNTICQGIERVYHLVHDGGLSSSTMVNVAQYYKEKKINILLYEDNVLTTATPEESKTFSLEKGLKIIQLINLIANNNYKSWTDNRFENFYLNMIRLLTGFLHKEFDNQKNYSCRNLIELVQATIYVFLPDNPKLPVNVDDLSHASLVVVKSLTNQTPGQSGKNTICDTSLTKGFYEQKAFNSILNTITSSYLTYSNLKDGMEHLKVWCDSVLRLQFKSKHWEDELVPQGRDRVFGFKAVYENSPEIHKKEQYICKKIMDGISPEKIKKAYLEYEEIIEKRVKEYYVEKQNSSNMLSQLRSCTKSEIDVMIHALRNSSDAADIRVFRQIKEAIM